MRIHATSSYNIRVILNLPQPQCKSADMSLRSDSRLARRCSAFFLLPLLLFIIQGWAKITIPRFREFFMQVEVVEAKVVSNSRNEINQIWEQQ